MNPSLNKSHKIVQALGYDNESSLQALTEINAQHNQLYGLRKSIENCTSCPLSETCSPVAGMQFINSDIMIVGEVPSQEDVDMGIPFAGVGGFILTIILNKLGVKRDSLYLTNMVKCNKAEGKVTLEEAEQCLHHLYNELAIVKPKLIVTLGEAPLRVLSENSLSLGEQRGKLFTTETSLNIPVMPTYHPTYLAGLKGAELVKIKKLMWADLQKAFIHVGLLQ
jgi:DNA polymerase